MSRFEELCRREAASTALYAFDLIEHDSEDLRDLPLLDRKAAPARLLRDTEAGILLNEHAAEDGPTCLSTPVGLVPRALSPSGHLSIGTVLGLDQGAQSREHRGTAGAPRELE